MIFVALYLCLIVCCPTTQVFKTTPTLRMSSQTMMQTLEASYQEISHMTAFTYEKNKLVEAINLVLDLNDTEEKYTATEYLFKILSTRAGRIFMIHYRNFAETSARKAEEFLAQFRHATEPHKVSLKNTIHTFILDSLEVFQLHNIQLERYYTQDEAQEENEYFEDDPEEEAEFFDEAEYEEYEYPEEDEEYMDEDEQEAERRLLAARQKHEDLLKQVHDDMRRRDDPFFQDAMRVLKQQQKYWEDCKEEEKRQSLVFRNIIRRAMENETVIEPGVSFKCDYKLVECLTGSKINDSMTQILGAYVRIDYDEDLMNVGVYIFDGEFNHEFAVLADMKSMISELYKEIRKDTAQFLYDFGFCRDVSGLIAGYVC